MSIGFRSRMAGFALLWAMAFPGFADTAYGQTCEYTCGDGSSGTGTPVNCDWCHILCLRRCRGDVTSCTWDGEDVTGPAREQSARGSITVRQGSDPDSPTAPTETVPFHGGVRVEPQGATETDGRVQIPIEIIEMQLQGVSPVPVIPLGDTQIDPPVPPQGLFEDRFPNQECPFDTSIAILPRLQSSTQGTLNPDQPATLVGSIEENSQLCTGPPGPVGVQWAMANGPIQLLDGGGNTFGWIIDFDLEIIYSTPGIPTVSHWGLAICGLLLLVAGTLVVSHRRGAVQVVEVSRRAGP